MNKYTKVCRKRDWFVWVFKWWDFRVIVFKSWFFKWVCGNVDKNVDKWDELDLWIFIQKNVYLCKRLFGEWNYGISAVEWENGELELVWVLVWYLSERSVMVSVRWLKRMERLGFWLSFELQNGVVRFGIVLCMRRLIFK